VALRIGRCRIVSPGSATKVTFANEAIRGVTAEMAIRLEKAGWGSAESWLRNQVSYDLWQVKKRAAKIKVKKFPSPQPV